MSIKDDRHARSGPSETRPDEFQRFAEDVERQAHIMQQAGWVRDASNLREWVRELRDKSLAAARR